MSPETLDRARIRQHFSKHADEYDFYARVQKSVAAQLVELAAAGPEFTSVLDIGTGTGAVAERLRRRCPHIDLTVSDLAHEMTAAAQMKLPGALAVDADAQRLPFRDAIFDLVVSASVYQWVDDLEAAFAENFRLLKPGGRFAFALFADGTLGELEDVFRRSLQGCHAQRPFHFQSFPQEAGVRQALGAAGFRQLDAEVRHEAEYHATVRDLLVGLKKIGAQNAAKNRPTGLFPRRVLAQMEQLYRKDYDSAAGLCATYSVLYGVARKGLV